MPKPRQVFLEPIETEFLFGRRCSSFSGIGSSILCAGAGVPAGESFEEVVARMAAHFKKCDQEAATGAPSPSEESK